MRIKRTRRAGNNLQRAIARELFRDERGEVIILFPRREKIINRANLGRVIEPGIIEVNIRVVNANDDERVRDVQIPIVQSSDRKSVV